MSKTITMFKDSPVSIKPGVYSDTEIVVMSRILPASQFVVYGSLPSIVTELDRPVDMELPMLKLKDVKIAKSKADFIVTGSCLYTKSKEKIEFNDYLSLNQSLVKVTGDKIIILTLTKGGAIATPEKSN